MAALSRPGHWLTLQPPDFDTNNQIENQGGEQKRGKKHRNEKEKCLFVQRLIKLTEPRAVPRNSVEVLDSQDSGQNSEEGQLPEGECRQTGAGWVPLKSSCPGCPRQGGCLLPFMVRGRIL